MRPARHIFALLILAAGCGSGAIVQMGSTQQPAVQLGSASQPGFTVEAPVQVGSPSEPLVVVQAPVTVQTPAVPPLAVPVAEIVAGLILAALGHVLIAHALAKRRRDQ